MSYGFMKSQADEQEEETAGAKMRMHNVWMGPRFMNHMNGACQEQRRAELGVQIETKLSGSTRGCPLAAFILSMPSRRWWLLQKRGCELILPALLNISSIYACEH